MKKLFAFTLVLISPSLFAGAGWSGKATVTGFYAVSNSQVVIKLSNFANPHNCNVDGTGDILLNPNEDKTWYTLLLSAYMANKEVNIYVNGSCEKTHWATPSFGSVGHVRVY